MLKDKTAYSIIAIGIIAILGTAFYSYEYYTEQSKHEFDKGFANDVGYDKSDLYYMHDVIVDGNITVWSNDTKPYVILRINEYLKNPQDAEYLTVWGDFGLNGDHCIRNQSTCNHILAYLYKNKNGIYRQGETFAWVTDSCDARCILGIDLEKIAEQKKRPL